MTVLLTSSRQTAIELVSILGSALPTAWDRHARRTGWGSVAWAGEQVTIVGDWLILGIPSADPWGWPGQPIEAEQVATRLSLFGPSAVRTASGPFLVLDLRSGNVTLPGNGIVPFWAGGDLSSTCQAIADSGAIKIGPIKHSGFERSDRTALEGRRIRAELLEHRPEGVLDRDALVPGPFDSLWSRGAQAAVRLSALRDEACRKWTVGRLHNRWLHAPALERPVVDRLLAAGS